MGDTGRRPPGWYRDPDDPALLRHWSGRGWSAQRRAWPAWDLSGTEVVADTRLPGGPDAGGSGGPVPDGPVRPVPMPAAALRAQLGTGGDVAWLQRPVRTAPRRAGSRSTPGGHRSPAAPPVGWAPTRKPLIVFCALVAVAVTLMGVSVGLTAPRRTPVGLVAADTAFVGRATALCDGGLTILHSSPTGMAAAPDQAATLAASARRDADAVVALASSLRALPTAQADSTLIAGWLASWDGYAADQHRLATALAAPTAIGPQPAADPSAAQLAARVQADVAAADRFAGDNGLTDCRLSGPAAAGGSLISIP